MRCSNKFSDQYVYFAGNAFWYSIYFWWIKNASQKRRKHFKLLFNDGINERS